MDAQGKKFRKAAKILSIHSSPVYSLSRVDRFLVSGAEDGYVRFFDDRLRLVAWFEVRLPLLHRSIVTPSCADL